MLERGPQRFAVKPSGVPDMAPLYDLLPNFTEVLDDVKRHVALSQDSHDSLEVTPILLLGPPGVGKTHFARQIADLLGTIKPLLTVAGCSYLLYLAWQIQRSSVLDDEDSASKPMSFMGGIWFQWLNPKTWMISLNMGMVFLPQNAKSRQAAVLFFVVVFATMMPCISVWAGAGVALQRLLNTPRRMRLFNTAMALTLAATAMWLLLANLPASPALPAGLNA